MHPLRASSAAFLAASLVLFDASPLAAAEKAEGPLRVLFLGDQGHHRPADRFKQLEPVLADRQIELVYTESMQDLNPARLAGFDALLIYANVTPISADQEKAMLDFVDRGGGLVPLHCASYCFHNSPAYIELVGAQFQKHGTGVFQETIVNAEHSVMKGLSPIESWDETYVHTRHNTNRVVLAERRDATNAEPWTWVRQHGRGRVFYTAWGHDRRTWSNDGFQALVESGIRWAAANSPTRLKLRAGLKAFEYVDSPSPLPNYTPNAKWGTQGEPIRTMQKPLEPADSMKHLVTWPDFEVSLFASEPDLVKPIWIAWDERGRLWIAETIDYPNELQPAGQGRDRLKICEDTNGDGSADKFTVFADSLSIPTSFVFANGGVIVIHSGKTEFFKDTNGDDQADERKVLFSGWVMRDTHATASNLRYGFDNWIWGTVGYSGFDGVVGGKSVRFGQGFFRFKPDGSALEFVRSSNNNTWGLGLTEDNLIVGSTANGNASMYMPIANRYYEAVRGWSASRLESIAETQRFYPLTEKVRQVDWHGRYTAGAGSAVYTARQFPRLFWNSAQFVAEPTGHLLGLFFLQPRGADLVALNTRNFVASDDEWTSPVCAEVGPEGALWVVDWYNYVVQHNPTPHGFSTGKGNAYETPLRDKAHGRIYRINASPAKTTSPPPLDSEAHLVAALKNDNLLWRMHAQRLLIERQTKNAIPALCELIANARVDEIGLNAPALHALWTLAGLHALEGSDAKATAAVRAALKHPSAAVRRAAATLLPRDEASCALLVDGPLADPQPQVRLAALLALAEMPPAATAGEATFKFLKDGRNAQDRWLLDAATAAAARHDLGFLNAALSSTNVADETLRVIRLVAGHHAQGAPLQTIAATVGRLPGATAAVVGALLDGLIKEWPTDQSPDFSAADKQLLEKTMQALPDSTKDRLLVLAQRWGRAELFKTTVAQITGSLQNQVLDNALNDQQRTAAAKRWVAVEDKPETVEAVLKQVTLLSPPELGNGMIEAIAESRDPRSGKTVIDHWKQFTPAVRRTALNILMRRSEWTSAILEAIQNDAIGKTDLAPEHWAQLKQNPNRGIAGFAERLAGSAPAISAERQELVAKLLPLAREKGDPGRGKLTFATNCAVCHTFKGEGKQVGPDLNGIAARDRNEILLDIIDPNRSVEANYRSWSVTTKDGESYSGRLDAETQTAIEILDATSQKHVIQRKDVVSLEASALSIMPSGFELLPADDLKGLLEYLTQP